MINIVIPNSVTSFGFLAFESCSSLTNVTIPNSVTSIEQGTFMDCSSLANVTIPDSVFSIGSDAFRNCISLINIVIPNSVTSIGFNAFSGDTNMTSMVVSSDNPMYDSRNNCNAIIETATNTLISGCKNTVIPNSVTSIGDCAFEYCLSLTNVTIPNSVTSIGSVAFRGCSSLTDITIPNSVTSIGSGAFIGCVSFTSVTIPDSVTSIEGSTFWRCYSLTYVTIPNSVTSIGQGAFQDCSSLTNVTIPNSVTSIENSAFRGCSTLSSVTIPNSVTSIGNSAFRDCSIDTLNMGHIVPLALSSNNTSLPQANIIFIPCGATANYQNTWGAGNYHEPDPAILILSVLDNNGTAFIEPQHTQQDTLCSGSTAVIHATANYGYHFTQWNDGNTDNPRTITLTQDTSFAAQFAKNLYHIDGIPNFSGRGSVSGHDTVEYLDTVVLTATSNYGYHFSQWNDGNTGNPRYVTASQNLTFTAQFDYNQYSISLDVNDSIRGTASGEGTYNYLSERTISVTANYGYHFTQWNDGNTDNPRTITLTQDTSFTAQFAKNLYSVTGVAQNGIQGAVLGSDTVEYLDTVMLTATSNCGYHFAQWNDGNTDNPRYVTATQNLTFTAQFDYNQYSISLEVNDGIRGTASGEGMYNYLSERTISATPNYGYHFTQWNDGNTDNPRTITLTQDTSFTAQFAKNQYTLTVSGNDTTIGSVSGSGVYEYLDTATITASVTAPHHHFVQWNDGVTDTLCKIIITQNLSLMAIFAIDTHYVAVTVNNNYYGAVSGVGEFPYGSTATLTPNPENGYYFVHWNNGDTTNPNIFTVTGDTSLSALFAPEIVPSICMVSVENDRNVLSWEKEQPVSGYNIYREGITSNVYELLTTIPYDSLSVWTDTSSRPRTRSYRYCLSATDIYAHEADMSDIHKTMHLTISQGVGNQWNLVWTEYEGTNYTTYVIYRGSDASNIQQIDVMPSGGNTSYTDVNAPAGDVYYKVGIMLSSPCNPSKNNYMIMSNIATNSTVGIPANDIDNINVFAQNGHVIINSSNDLQDVRIYDLTGKLLKTVQVGGNSANISISDFAAGIYMVQIRTENGTVTRKVVK